MTSSIFTKLTGSDRHRAFMEKLDVYENHVDQGRHASTAGSLVAMNMGIKIVCGKCGAVAGASKEDLINLSGAEMPLKLIRFVCKVCDLPVSTLPENEAGLTNVDKNHQKYFTYTPKSMAEDKAAQAAKADSEKKERKIAADAKKERMDRAAQKRIEVKAAREEAKLEEANLEETVDKKKISKKVEDNKIDEAGAESFPASDPPSWTPTHTGKPAAAKKKSKVVEAKPASKPAKKTVVHKDKVVAVKKKSAAKKAIVKKPASVTKKALANKSKKPVATKAKKPATKAQTKKDAPKKKVAPKVAAKAKRALVAEGVITPKRGVKKVVLIPGKKKTKAKK